MEIHGCSRNFWNRWQNIVTWDVSHHFIKYHISWRKGERERRIRRSEREIYVSELHFMPLFLYSQFFMFLASPRLLLFLAPLYASFLVNALRHFYRKNYYGLYFLICFLFLEFSYKNDLPCSLKITSFFKDQELKLKLINYQSPRCIFVSFVVPSVI